MPKVPGIFKNGDGGSGIPDDIKWDEVDRPVVFSCSQDVEHAPYCNKQCNSWMPDESEVKLLNEARAWARLGMSFDGVPTSINGISGPQVNIFDEKIRTATLQDMLIEKGFCTQEEIDAKFRANKLDAMQGMRAASEEEVRRNRAMSMIAVPNKKLLGPDGGTL